MILIMTVVFEVIVEMAKKLYNDIWPILLKSYFWWRWQLTMMKQPQKKKSTMISSWSRKQTYPESLSRTTQLGPNWPILLHLLPGLCLGSAATWSSLRLHHQYIIVQYYNMLYISHAYHVAAFIFSQNKLLWLRSNWHFHLIIKTWLLLFFT